MAKDLPVEGPLVRGQRAAWRLGGHPCQGQPLGTPVLVEKHPEEPVARAGGS
jgi:hypothetical protein